MRDPKAPVKALAVEEMDAVIIKENGEVHQALEWTFSPEDVGRIRAGYVCVQCFEPHEEAYPVRCSVCKFPMKERQAEVFAAYFVGNKRLGPEVSDEDLLEELAEWGQREDMKKRDEILRPSQILLPGRDFSF